ncbi:MAG: hypothetical protein QG611_1090 [Bacteroidota bacterium]|nr:hypothetical protein [Bacteroidota bacterium]
MKLYPIFPLVITQCFTSCSSVQGPEDSPSILIIHTDEHNFRTLGCYRKLLPENQAFVWGKGINVETPNIDFLAQNGVTFTKFYASTPVSSPSRASFVSGRYPQHTGVTTNDVPMDDKIVTFAEVFSQHGYSTGYAGKWHLDGPGRPQWTPVRKFGFTDNKYMFNRGHWKKLAETTNGPEVASIGQNGLPDYKLNGADEQSFTTDFLTERAIRFIRQNNPKATGKPFCFMLSFPDPHDPDVVRQPYDTIYRGLPFEAPVSYDIPEEEVPRWAKEDIECSIDQSQYFGMVKCIDDNVGKILQYLKDNNLLQNTIIVFTSDHGDMRAEHHRQNKGIPFEASAKIPFVVYYPAKIKAGSFVDNSFSTVDFAPSILKLAGFDYPASMQGRDFSPLMEKSEDQKKWDDITIIRSTGLGKNGSWIAAITSRYKLVLSKGETPWLLDLEKDPFELTNHISIIENDAVVKQLAAKLQQYNLKFNDPYLKETNMESDMIQLLAE